MHCALKWSEELWSIDNESQDNVIAAGLDVDEKKRRNENSSMRRVLRLCAVSALRQAARPGRRAASSGRRVQLFRPGAPEEALAHCLGCGWAFQSSDAAALGFVPPRVPPPPLLDPLARDGRKKEEEKREREGEGEREGERGEEQRVCQRCHRLAKHNEMLVPAPDQSQKLASLKDRPGVVLLMADLTDVEGTVPDQFARLVSGSNPVILVGNKLDLLPPGATDLRLRTWLGRVAESKGLYPVGVHVTSSHTGEGVTRLVKEMAERSHNFKKDVFLCGRTNVGKSSMLNKLIRMYGGPKRRVTVSGLHGTTVGLIPVALGHDGGRHIYDTPGLLAPDRIYNVLSPEELAIVQPARTRIEPVVYRLVPGKSLVLGDFGRLDYVEGAGHLLFTTFLSKRLSKLVRATAVDRDLQTKTHALQAHTFEFDGDSPDHTWTRAWVDIAFGGGIGFISVTGRAPGAPIKLVAHSLVGAMPPSTREPLMPFEAAATELKRLGRPIVKHGSVKAFQSRRIDGKTNVAATKV